MDIITDTLTFIANNVFGQVPILIGLITFIGLAVQGKRLEDIVSGTLRATVGIVVLFIGVDVFTDGLVGFQEVLASAMGTTPPTSDHSLAEFLASHGGSVALVITAGFAVHLLLVRLFPAAGYLYLTGHLMFWISAITVAALVQIAPDAGQLTLVLCGAGVVAAYWTVQPLWMRPLMRKVVPQDTFGFGHTSSLVCVATGFLARPFGSRERHDSESLKLPRQLSFFKDVNVSTALVIGLVMLLAVAFADPDVAAAQAAEVNEDLSRWVWALIIGLRFAAGLAVVLFGVRMFLAEIVPAFKGVSDRLIPGTRPALDAPTVFPVAPTAVMLGFIGALGTFLALIGVFALADWFTLAPPMIMLFFVGGAAGVFGNVVAGWRGAVLGGVLTGVWLAIGQALTWGMLDSTAPELATLADPDWFVLAWLLLALEPLGSNAVWAAPVVALAATAVTLLILGRRQHRSDPPAAAGTTPEEVAP
ncbi:PTS ascorbate transporter subunit IIC [Aeromicrobium sp. CTD01-1L150]|uniref:PTS ascorbate transporter subunit IIC n=1 Tax=Aeromicrobium sp. CTD01-1L150 TaxID=3341830 RepID=UPI0035BECB30